MRRVIEPVLAGRAQFLSADRADLACVRAPGLTKANGEVEIANPIYREVVPRLLSPSAEPRLTAHGESAPPTNAPGLSPRAEQGRADFDERIGPEYGVIRVVGGDPHRVPVAPAITPGVHVRAPGPSNRSLDFAAVSSFPGRVTGADRVTGEFGYYERHRDAPMRRATAAASGGGTAFATWRCWSRSGTRPVRPRIGPMRTCPSGKCCSRAASRGVM